MPAAAGRRAPILDSSFFMILGLLVVLAALAWWRGGSELLQTGVTDGFGLLVRYSLLIAVAFLAAGIAQVLIPHDAVEGVLGDQAGLSGIGLAALAGMLTPSGPFVSLPIAATLLKSGASPGAVVAYVSAWSLLALHRLVVWEVPILGLRFALIRWGLCLLLPIAAGLAAQGFKRFLVPS